jgi:hypothetical protein
MSGNAAGEQRAHRFRGALGGRPDHKKVLGGESEWLWLCCVHASAALDVCAGLGRAGQWCTMRMIAESIGLTSVCLSIQLFICLSMYVAVCPSLFNCSQDPRLAHLLDKLHSYLSLSSPHLGTQYGESQLVSTGGCPLTHSLTHPFA